jgi:hypothetical protein
MFAGIERFFVFCLVKRGDKMVKKRKEQYSTACFSFLWVVAEQASLAYLLVETKDGRI